MTGSQPLNCVVIPFYNSGPEFLTCLDSLLENLPDNCRIILVDDGSEKYPEGLNRRTENQNISLLKHGHSKGPGGARNTAIQWCREHYVELVILLDCDCIPGSDFIQTHIRLHSENPQIECIGGGIQGVGDGLWADLDRVASWFTSIPESEPRLVHGLYHIPTTNMSLKLERIPLKYDFFDVSLITGEDVKFVNQIRKKGCNVWFFPKPVVCHKDRASFLSFVKHQYRWGRHTYAMRFGGKGSLLFRLILASVFGALSPMYAAAATLINIIPWIKVSKKYWKYSVPLIAVYALKSIAVVEGIIWPSHALKCQEIQ